MQHDHNANDSLASYIDKAEEKLHELIVTQFRRSVMLVVVSLTLFFAIYAGIVVIMKKPANDQLLKQIEASNNNLVRISTALFQTQAVSKTPTPTATLEVVTKLGDLSAQALTELKQQQAQVSPEGMSFVQLLGGSVVLALLGYLGLQRMQNLDAEMQSLRTYMFEQIKDRVSEERTVMQAHVDTQLASRIAERVTDLREVLHATLRGEVEEFFSHSKVEIDASIGKSLSEVDLKAKAYETQMAEIHKRSTDIENRIKEVIGRYQWLGDDSMRNTAESAGNIASVESAHDLAVRFNANDDIASARKVLRMVVDKNLVGAARDLHNAHTEAMRIGDPELALAIVESGLSRFPEEYDLMADKARALIESGRVAEARNILEDWQTRKPLEFSRGWRPVVFYAQTVTAGELTPDAVQRLEKAFGDVTGRYPHETKPWSAYARFEKGLGNRSKAEEVLRTGIKNNPFNQELNYVLGEMLLEQGNATESIKFLEASISCDYQDQFQHDVSQEAVRATLAQAYECAGHIEKAATVYASILEPRERFIPSHIRAYAMSRIAAINVLIRIRSNAEQALGADLASSAAQA